MNNDQLKKAGLKTTLPRVKILEILETSGFSHLSAEDKFKAPYTAETHYQPARHHLASSPSGRPASFAACEEQLIERNNTE